MNRRSFLSRIVRAVAVAVAAPVIVREAIQAQLPVASYRSNMIGIYEQLKQCADTIDTSKRFDFYEFIEENDAILCERKRNRR